jgi:hypothetical protein
MSGELQLMRDFFFDRMNADTTFRNQLGGDGIFQRVGQPILATQTNTYPIVNIRNMGPVFGGALRIKNKGGILWIQNRWLVVAIKDTAIYPASLAASMESLFELTASLTVTGGVIYHSYLEAPYELAYADSSGKKYFERGGFWICAAKSDS